MAPVQLPTNWTVTAIIVYASPTILDLYKEPSNKVNKERRELEVWIFSKTEMCRKETSQTHSGCMCDRQNLHKLVATTLNDHISEKQQGNDNQKNHFGHGL